MLSLLLSLLWLSLLSLLLVVLPKLSTESYREADEKHIRIRRCIFNISIWLKHYQTFTIPFLALSKGWRDWLWIAHYPWTNDIPKAESILHRLSSAPLYLHFNVGCKGYVILVLYIISSAYCITTCTSRTASPIVRRQYVCIYIYIFIHTYIQ